MIMQKLNIDTSLYQIEGSSPIYIPGRGNQVSLELYDTTARMTQVSAYTFHPNKATLWDRIVNWVIELFFGRTCVLVRAEGEPTALYVRVDDLSRVLNVSSESILRACRNEDATEFIIGHQMEQTVEKIKKLAQKPGFFWTRRERDALQGLMQEVGYRHLFKVLDNGQFNSQTMAATLIEIGKHVAQSLTNREAAAFPGTYEFKISLPNISIWKTENFKKTQINLSDLSISEEDFLMQTTEKIKKLTQLEGVAWSETDQRCIERLISKFGYQNVLEAMNCSQFQPGKMACTLVEIGRELAEFSNTDPQYKRSYQYIIDLPRVDIWRTEHGKKIKMDLNDLTVKVEDLPKPSLARAPKTASGSKPKSPTLLNRITKVFAANPNKEKEEFELITRCFNVHPIDKKHLATLADRVGYPNLLAALGQLERNEKNIMINTFIDIGKEISGISGFFSRFRLKYQKEKMERTAQRTYAFALNKKEIFIVQGSNPKEGSFKHVCDAIKLNNLSKPFVKIEIKDKKSDGGALSDTCSAAGEFKKEVELIANLHKQKKGKEKGSDCIILPFACEIATGKDKNSFIYFQKKYTGGDGNDLKSASLVQKMHVLKDIAQGLAFIHKSGIVHMDMKPANFLIDGDKGKVSDFGMAVKNGSILPGGSLLYLPPEALFINRLGCHFNLRCRANDKIDCFAFGVTTLEILNGQSNPPHFGSMTQRQIDAEIARYSLPPISLSPAEREAHIAFTTIAKQLLRHDPAVRYSCAEAALQMEEICSRL